MKHLIALCGIILAPTFVQPAVADISSARGAASQRVSLNGPQRVTITWTLTLEDLDGIPDRGQMITSPPAQLSTGGSLPVFAGAMLTDTEDGERSLRIRESLTLPVGIARAAAESGGEIQILREFTSGRISATAVATISVTGGLGGEGRVEQLVLRFENGAQFETVTHEGSLRAEAEMRLSGDITRLRGVWEYAPQEFSISGEPQFETLASVSKATGRRRSLTLISPPLPTHLMGVGLVRFRLTDPALTEQSPAIGYLVQSRAVTSIGVIDELAPQAGGRVTAETVFTWRKSSEGGALTRLEILSEGTFITGMGLPSAENSAALSAPVLSRLEQGKSYEWRVITLDQNGRPVAASQTEKFLFAE